jgi:hypothetical protein
MSKMTFIGIHVATTAVVLSGAALGCIGQDTEGQADELVGETSDAVSSNTYWYGLVGGFDIDIGTSTDRTCFLSAVNGKIYGGSSFATNVEVKISNGRWRLRADPGPDANAYVGAGAVCINTDDDRTNRVWWFKSYGAPQDLGTWSIFPPTRACFLTAVRSSQGFDNASDEVKVWADPDGHWKIGGTDSGAFDSVGGAAVCVDVSNQGGAGSVSGSSSIDLIDNNSGGWACALTGIGGTFTANNWDGPEVVYDSASAKWRLTSDTGKKGSARCVK